MENVNNNTDVNNTDKKIHISDVIPRYKFGTYHHDDEIPEYDWFIIDMVTDKIVDKLKNVSLSDVRIRCKDWNNNIL